MSVSEPVEPGEGTPEDAVLDVADCIEELSEALADTISFKFRAHAAHWNVKGPAFGAYHELFEEIYEDADGAIDPLAEQLLKLDVDAPSTLSEFAQRATVQPMPVASDDPAALAVDLRDMNDSVLESLEDAYDCANELGELAGVANFLAERIDMHRKWRWQLTRSISNPSEPKNDAPMNPPEATEVEEEDQGQVEMPQRMRIVDAVEVRDNPGLVAEIRSGDVAERRAAPSTTEVRSNPDGSWTLVGHAAVFDSSANLGSFTESIQRGAFRRILNQDGLDVRALFNHDPNLVLGRTPGTLTLREDPTGLAYEVNVAPTTAGNDLRILLERGDITQSSFAFQVGGQEWRDMPDGTLHRTITDFKDLLDVSPVTYPAYADTTAGVRSETSSSDSSEQDAGGAAAQPNAQADESSRRADEDDAHRLRLRRQRLRERAA
jgi:uncharacterized protein